MDRGSLYDNDIHAWAERQAEALRRLAESRQVLPNELDLEQVAEEIEDVGRSELNRVESFVRLLLLHLVKVASAPQARSSRKWLNEVLVFQGELSRKLTPSMRGKLDVDDAWRVACLRAEGELDEAGDRVLPDLPATCPFTLDELASEAFDHAASLERLGIRG